MKSRSTRFWMALAALCVVLFLIVVVDKSFTKEHPRMGAHDAGDAITGIPAPNVVNTTGNVDNQIGDLVQEREATLRTSEAGRALLDGSKDPKAFVRSPFSHGVPYAEVRRRLRHDDLPVLYAMLKDPGQASYWHRIAETIAYLSNKGDQPSIEALTEYARRPVDWNIFPEKERWFAGMGKVRALSWLGLIGDEETLNGLQKSLSHEGAQEMGRQWLSGSLPPPWDKDPEQAVANLRGYAAIGLIYSGQPERVKIVEALYATENARSQETKKVDNFYNALVTAMAERELIEKINLQGRLRLTGEGGAEGSALEPFILKHAWYLSGQKASNRAGG
jgi:hypothetical protein